MSPGLPTPLWAPRAWLPDAAGGAWASDVLLQPGADGRWAGVRAGLPCPVGATRLPGAVLPGMVDAHSHAFQRAFAGLAERLQGAHDDFWSWREAMYGVANRISTAQLRAVAAQLYAELLCGGYTQVCEFHYLHRCGDEQDPLPAALALADAAAQAGIGLSLLPALYAHAGFGEAALRPQQARFHADAGALLRLRQRLHAALAGRPDGPGVVVGAALHSLRAAWRNDIEALLDGLRGAQDRDAPLHIHVAEQTAEVEQCLAARGARPIEWLAREGRLDARWQLVHATHATPEEIAAVAASGAGVVLCPSTEADLGDGLPDLPRWLAAGVPLSLGSDSQVGRCWAAELRLLEQGQRLALRRRNVAADAALLGGSTAARLFTRCLAGGAAAAGLGTWGLQPGARADLLVLDVAAPGLRGVPPEQALDALVFATEAPALAQVWVAGRCVVHGGRHRDAEALAAGFDEAMAALWRGGA